MSRQNSMATFHPDLLNEIYLNRIRKNENNSIIAGDQAIEVKTARLAPSELVFTPDNQPLNPGSGKKTVIIQAGISHRTVKEGGALARVETGVVTFTMAQVRLLCKASDSAKNLGGSSQVVYPVGILRNENSVDRKNLTDEMLLTRTDFAGGGTKWLDFVFYIPTDTTPVMLQFKMNAVAPVGKLQKIEEKPQTPASPTSPTTTP